MSGRIHIPEPEPHGAPRWYVGFSTLTTILMTFFITLTVNMANARTLGYAGPGVGAFRQGFTSHGMPGILRGARRIVDFFTWADKFQPEETAEGQGEVYTGRLIEMPERDLKQALTHLAKTSSDVVLPLPLHYEPPARSGQSATRVALDAPSREQLAAAAHLIRKTKHSVMVCATLPCGHASSEQPAAGSAAESEEKVLCRAAEWALLIARHLAETEMIPADRLMAVGRVALPDSTGNAKEPSVTLVMRPRVAHDASPLPEADPLRRRAVTQYEMVR